MRRSNTSASGQDLSWPDLPSPPPHGADGVLVVAAGLHCSAARELEVDRWLVPEEQRRAQAFSRADLRRRFVASRGVLREVLAQCAGTEPGALTFTSGSHGKPALQGHGSLQFNLAHSADLMLLAVGTCGELGVDVEQVRPLSDAAALARRFFTAREAAWLEARPEIKRDTEFFRLWTRKEAVLKACGLGIAHGLDRLELIDGDGSWRRRVTFPESSASEWTVKELQPAAGHVGAVALPVPASVLRCYTWREASPRH